MHQNSRVKNSKKLLAIYVVVILALFYIFRDQIYNIAPTFQLTNNDLKMIPFGALLFLVFWQVAERVLFRPYLKLFEAREAATIGSVESSVEMLERAEKITNEVNLKIYEARSKLAKERENVLAETKKICDGKISSEDQAAQERLATARQSNKVQVDTLKNELESQIESLSRDVVEKISRAETR